MKPMMLTALLLAFTFAATPTFAAAGGKAAGAKAAKAAGLTPGAAAATGKAAKAAAAAKQPLLVLIEKVDGQTLTVMTQPMMGPDGLIPAKEKTYDATNATSVVLNGATKTLTDLVAGGQAHITITDDGKTVEKIQEQIVTPADKAAKKAARQAKNSLPVVPPQVP